MDFQSFLFNESPVNKGYQSINPPRTANTAPIDNI